MSEPTRSTRHTNITHPRPLLASLRKHRHWLRAIAILVTGAFLNLTLQPLALATQLPSRPEAPAPTNDERLSQTLQAIEDRLAKLDAKLEKGEDTARETAELTTLRQELTALDTQALEDFAAIERHLKDKQLPQVILDRHSEAVRNYQAEMATLKGNLADLYAAPDDADRKLKAKRAKEHLAAKRKRVAPVPPDPSNLPTRMLAPNRGNTPKLSKAAFSSEHLFDNPYPQFASHGSYRFDGLPGATDPAYLAPTAEVVLSNAIRAKAEELEHNPVKIYQWVRNNVEWLPSWGAMRDAEATLHSLKGNAFDTAALLIALLRASGVPSRFVHGVIEVPTDKFMNWAGGFTDPNSAWDLVSSGGVPVSGVVSGGKVVSFRVEHIWVEAAIDFHPSRGAVNKSADSWVALDAAYKVYDITPGIDVTAAVPFDAVHYLSTIQPDSPVAHYQQRIQTHLESTNPEASVGEGMGFMLIRPDTSGALPTGAPYKVLLAANRYGALPPGLRTTVQLSFLMSGVLEPETVSFSTVALANKRLTLSYLPATAADETTIARYGGDMYAVPPYLLYLIPTLKADGHIIYQGAPMPMGQEHSLVIAYSAPTFNARSMPHRLISGGYYAIGLNVQGADHNLVGNKNQRLIETLTTLDPASASTDALIGEHLSAIINLWFLSNDKQYRGAAKLYRVAEQRAPSAGLAGFALTVRYFFGLPRSTSINRAQLDVGLEAGQAASRDGNNAKRSAYLEIRGLTGSFNEHYIWEAIHGFDSVSAVKGLQAANAQGVAVYMLNQSNFAQLFPLLQLAAEDEQEIQQAVQSGLTAVVPQREVTINQWTGAGFILKDPQTHSGLYRISGGLSGGSSTSQADGFQIVSLFRGPFAWLRDKLDVLVRSTIRLAAMVEALFSESDEEIQRRILQGALSCNLQSYEQVGRCTGLVIKAYNAAGIDLVALARRNGTGNPSYVPNLYRLANALNGVRLTNNPLVGDIIFWEYTYDRNGTCLLEDDEQPTHVGIVQRANIDGQGTLTFVHASSSGVSADEDKLKMNIQRRDDVSVNAFMRSPPKEGCPSDGNSRPKLSGQLFKGFGTIRNPSQ